MAESKLASPIKLRKEWLASYCIMCPVMCSVYLAPQPYCDIRCCCCQSVNAFTSRSDSTLLSYTFLTLNVFLHNIRIISFVRFMYCYIFKIIDSHTGMPRRGAKDALSALSPGPQGLEGSFRYQNDYYLSVMQLSIANAQLFYRQWYDQ